MPDTHPVRPSQNQDAYHQLIAAIVLQAVRDAASQSRDLADPARWWLAGEGQVFCLLLGLNLTAIRSWLESGCPAPDSSLDPTLLSRPRSSSPRPRAPG